MRATAEAEVRVSGGIRARASAKASTSVRVGV